MYLYLFIAIASCDLLALAFGFETVHLICKPFLMPLLIAFYLSQKQKTHWVHSWTLVGLFFGWIGDVALMGSGSLYFMMGLGAFLIGHLCYIGAFYLTTKPNNPSVLKRRPYFLLPVLGYGIIMFSLLKPHLGSLFIPVSVYVSVIITMLIMAMNRLGKVQMRSFLSVLIGASAFVLSDSLLAWNKFVGVFPFAGVAIMLTYLLAQYYIAMGMLQQVERV